MVEPVTVGILTGGVGGVFAFFQALINHPLMAYVFIVAGLSLTTGIEQGTGIGLASIPINYLLNGVFGIPVQLLDWQILTVFVIFPVFVLAIKKSKPM